jgi:xanthosine utilization system XapX-like protein
MATRRLKISIFDPTTRKEKNFEKEISSEILQKLSDLTKSQDIVPEENIIYAIHNLNIPAEAKAILIKLKELTIKVGSYIIKLGKRILEFILYLLQEFPNTVSNAIIGSVIGFTFSFIPVLGPFISSVLTPLFVALGLTLGFLEDLKNKKFKSQVMKQVYLKIDQELKPQLVPLREL